MSNDPKSQPQPLPPKPSAPTSASPAGGEIRIADIRFVTANLPITGINSSNDRIVGRTAEKVENNQDGIDITLNMATGFYTLTKIQRGAPNVVQLIHVSRVDLVTVW
jgi:hypothetical protein